MLAGRSRSLASVAKLPRTIVGAHLVTLLSSESDRRVIACHSLGSELVYGVMEPGTVVKGAGTGGGVARCTGFLSSSCNY